MFEIERDISTATILLNNNIDAYFDRSATSWVGACKLRRRFKTQIANNETLGQEER